MRREHPEFSASEINEAFDAWLQWMAGHVVNPHQENTYVMLLGPIDEAFHASILCTRKYMEFCKTKVGFFIHHTPVSEEEAVELTNDGAILYTINFLRKQFGQNLAPMLVRWEDDYSKGKLCPSAVSCKWGLNSQADSEFLAHFGLTSFTDRWKQAA